MMDLSSTRQDSQSMATDTMAGHDLAASALSAPDAGVVLPVPREDEDEFEPTIIRGRE